MSEEERARYDKALQIADGVKLYASAGGVGVASQWRPYWEQLQKSGGLPEATVRALARYRMWKQGLALPDHVMPDLTDEQKAQRREMFINGDATVRARLMDEDRAANHNGLQRFYDSLMAKPPPAPPAAIAAPGVQGVPQQQPPASIAAEEVNSGGV